MNWLANSALHPEYLLSVTSLYAQK
jgi:hypothetical protein